MKSSSWKHQVSTINYAYEIFKLNAVKEFWVKQ